MSNEIASAESLVASTTYTHEVIQTTKFCLKLKVIMLKKETNALNSNLLNENSYCGSSVTFCVWQEPGSAQVEAVAPGPRCQCEYVTCFALGLRRLDRPGVNTTYPPPPSGPQLDRSIKLNHSLDSAASVTDVSYFITVSQSSFDGWRAKLLWLNELLHR